MGGRCLSGLPRRAGDPLGHPRSLWASGRRRGRARPGLSSRAGVRVFLSNITNPKVLGVLISLCFPSSSRRRPGPGWLLAFAWSHAVLSLGYLLALTAGLHSARKLLLRRNVRRSLDAATGTVLLGFSARLAAEHA